MIDFGITRVADVTGLDYLGIPVYLSFRPGARSLCVSAGKGIDHKRSRISAIMESAESYYAENLCESDFVGSETKLVKKGIPFCSLKNLPRINYHQKLKEERIQWTTLSEITSKQELLFPFDLIHLDLSSDVANRNICISSNGLAISRTKEEALIHAICELIERDAYTVWFHSSFKYKCSSILDLSSINSDRVQYLCNKIRDCSLKLYIFDLTTDIKVPVYAALIATSKAINNEIVEVYNCCLGFGCHPNSETALLRSITEAAQSRLGIISGSRDEFFPEDYKPKKFEFWTLLIQKSKKFNSKKYFHSRSCNTRCVKNEISYICKELKSSLGNNTGIYYKYLGGSDNGLFCVRVVIPRLEASMFDAYFRPKQRALKVVFLR